MSSLKVVDASFLTYSSFVNPRLNKLDDENDLRIVIVFDESCMGASVTGIERDDDRQLDNYKSEVRRLSAGPSDPCYCFLLNTPGVNQGQVARSLGNNLINMINVNSVEISSDILLKRHISMNGNTILCYSLIKRVAGNGSPEHATMTR